MKTHVLRGSKREIAEDLVRIVGEVREVIVFEEESTKLDATGDGDDIFAEMRLFMSDAETVNDSRSAIYSRLDNE